MIAIRKALTQHVSALDILQLLILLIIIQVTRKIVYYIEDEFLCIFDRANHVIWISNFN